jgi:AcrR family transcriptional regulator
MEKETKPIDRRARRTRRYLKEALFALILEKGYDAITIEEITARADLGRTTFYLHYRDKEELLLESIDAIAADLITRLPPTAWRIGEISPGGGIIHDEILFTFQHAGENAQLYRIILRGEGASKAAGRIHSIITQKTTELLTEFLRSGAMSIKPKVPIEVFANYFAGALLAMVTWWLEADTPYKAEEMAAMFRQIFFQGGRNALGIE